MLDTDFLLCFFYQEAVKTAKQTTAIPFPEMHPTAEYNSFQHPLNRDIHRMSALAFPSKLTKTKAQEVLIAQSLFPGGP